MQNQLTEWLRAYRAEITLTKINDDETINVIYNNNEYNIAIDELGRVCVPFSLREEMARNRKQRETERKLEIMKELRSEEKAETYKPKQQTAMYIRNGKGKK